jgi:branched-chain amino acid transport system permease protein
MDILFASIVSGVLIGMVLALVALGLTIIFGVMDIVNFAHGEFLMIGMYTGLLTAQATGMDPLFCLPVAPPSVSCWASSATAGSSSFCCAAP